MAAISARNTLAKLDGRTREARLMESTRNDLVAHVGGAPSATQRAMIERAANLTVRIAIMDRRFAETKQQTEQDSRVYLAWTNTLSKTLRHLGLEGPPAKTKTLQDHLKERGA